MSTFKPLLFDGSIDQAETWLTRFIFVLNRRGEMVELDVVPGTQEGEDPKFPSWALTWRERLSLEPMSDIMGVQRFRITITTQVDDELHTSDLGHILLTPLPKSIRFEMATLESRQMREAVARFWEKLREHMRADAVLIERVQEVPNEGSEPEQEPEPDWWPRKASTRAVYQDDWDKRIKPQIDRGDKLVDIAAQMGVPSSRVSKIKRFVESREKHHSSS